MGNDHLKLYQLGKKQILSQCGHVVLGNLSDESSGKESICKLKWIFIFVFRKNMHICFKLNFWRKESGLNRGPKKGEIEAGNWDV